MFFLLNDTCRVGQLVALLKHSGMIPVTNLFSYVGVAFPQPVLFACFSALTAEQLADFTFGRLENDQMLSADADVPGPGKWQALLKRVMRLIQKSHPVEFSALWNLSHELGKLPEHWITSALRQVRFALADCYEAAFEHRNNLYGSECPSSIQQLVAQVADTISSVASPVDSSSSTESDGERKLRQKLAERFAADFDFAGAGVVNRPLHTLM